MKVGTKSILFGVHQFLIHPIVVTLAWRKLYKRWPDWIEAICILVHDWGYWGKSDMDGVEGKNHPEFGALLAVRIAVGLHYFFKRDPAVAFLGSAVYDLTVGHSSHYATSIGKEPSALCWADKYSINYEWEWFYLLRAKLSGELAEYIQNAPLWISNQKQPAWCWLAWYKLKVAERVSRALNQGL